MLLSIDKLKKSFGGLTAVNEIDFHIDSGEIVCLIGPNGSGKTTFFNLLTGIYQPDSGNISFTTDKEKLNIIGLKPHQINYAGISRTFQTIRLFANMTVIENVMVGMHCRTRTSPLGAIINTSFTKREEQEVKEKAFRLLHQYARTLAPLKNELAHNLPYADQRRLEIVRALASSPHLVLLDEPAAGMNPLESKKLLADIKRIRDDGYAVLVIEHDLSVVKGLSDRVVVFDYGRKIAEGSFDEVRQNPHVIEAYLGKNVTC
ncbi:MAG: ABC transporter ATP-binding protein [bacterium]